MNGKDERTPVILSTDIGSDIDDAVALQLLALSNTFKLISVIVTQGVLDIREVLTRKMLHNLGREDVVVAQGAEHALDESIKPYTTGFEGVALTKRERANHRKRIDGVDLLIEQVHESRPIVVSIAPMTTLIQAFQRDPSVCRDIPHLYILGGSIDASEHNIFFDPISAQMVFASGIPTTVVPIEATKRIAHTELTELKGSRNQRMIAKMAEALRIYRALEHLMMAREPEIERLFWLFDNDVGFKLFDRNPAFERMMLESYDRVKMFAKSETEPNPITRQRNEQLLRGYELLITLKRLLERSNWLEDFNGCHRSLTLALLVSKIMPNEYYDLFSLGFRKGIEQQMGIYDAYIPYIMENPEKARIESCHLQVDKGGKLKKSSGASHRLVIDVDHEHFRQFLRQRLRADNGLTQATPPRTRVRR